MADAVPGFFCNGPSMFPGGPLKLRIMVSDTAEGADRTKGFRSAAAQRLTAFRTGSMMRHSSFENVRA